MIDRDALPAHARYAPSAMARIIECPMSIPLSDEAPKDKGSAFAAEGTLAHDKCEAWVLEDAMPDFKGDDEMMEACRVFVDHVNPILDRAKKYGIEVRAVADDELFGTIDCYAVVDGILHVIDFKYGAGIPVAVQNNKQLLTYAACILLDPETGIGNGQVEVTGCMLTIIQPRRHDGGEPIQSWGCDIETVNDHLQLVDETIHISKQPNPPGKMGDHCRFCPCKIICPVLTAAETGVIEWEPNTIEPAALGDLLAEAQVLETKIKAVFNYAHEFLEAGNSLPGWKLVPKRATRVWLDEAKVLAWSKRNGKMGAMHKKALCSPAAAEKILGEKFDSLSHLVSKISSGTNLKQTDDPAEETQSLGSALNAIGSLPKR